jgi:sodium-dependent dicarboxylate transporter 2/3/5
VLTGWLYPNRLYENNNIQTYIQQELKSLGPLSVAEKRILIIFVSTASLWIFKDLWNQLGIFKLDDTIIAMLGALTLFATPAERQTNTKKQMLLKWSDTSVMSWGILLLFGGGIAMANSLERTGIMSLIGHAFADAASIKGVILILLIATLSIFMSELMSNVAQVIVLAPVLASIADASGHNSLQLGLAMTLAASAASMLPMGTPSNAIVFSSNHIPLKEMLKTGLIMNLISIVVITLLCRYLFPLIFQQSVH